MKTVLFSGLAATALLFAGSADANDSSGVSGNASISEQLGVVANGQKSGTPRPHVGGPRPGRVPMVHGPRPGYHGIPRHDVYRRPVRGFIMPRYWVQPTFFIANYSTYGLSAPTRGYNWSRYYDDAVLTDQRGYVQDYRSGIDWNAGHSREDADYGQPDYGPSIRADAQAYDWGDDGRVAFAAPDGSSYSYDGEWQGEFVDPEARVFEGEWEGTVTRHDGVSGPGYPAPRQAGAPYPGGPVYEDDYRVPPGYEGYERCLKSNGLKGATIGAILGGIAGNRIAGRGDRLGGTLVGAGIGGLAGVAIEKATDKCRQFDPRYRGQARTAHPQVHPQGYQQYGHNWQSGYYYYPQAPMVSVTVVPGGTHTTTTVTEEVYYETVRAAPRKKAVRKWKPKPKPRCVC